MNQVISLNTRSAQAEYFSRPVEDRCDGLPDMLSRMQTEANRCYETRVRNVQYTTDGAGNVCAMIGGSSHPLTFGAFNQVAGLHSAPPSFLRDLRAQTAADVLNETSTGTELKLLVSGDRIRAFNGVGYSRLMSAGYVGKINELAERTGLKTAPAWAVSGDPRTRVAAEADCGPFTLVKPGDMISPAGAYYSPGTGRDTFLFLISDRAIALPNGGTGFRFFVFAHSETGLGSALMLTGIMDKTCGNHMILNPTEVKKIRVIHRGAGLDERISLQMSQAVDMLDASDWESKLLAGSAGCILGSDAKEATAKAQSITGLSKASILKALDRIPSQDYGNPLSAYFYAGHLTEYSQTLDHVEDRRDYDDAASLLYNVAA